MLERDDDEAAQAASSLHLALSDWSRGAVADSLLYHRACGPRVRATLLKDAWLRGHFGSVLLSYAASVGMVVKYFRESESQLLMDAEELAELRSHSQDIPVFRGAFTMPGGPRQSAYRPSWTMDFATAERFARRAQAVDGEALILSARIPTSGVLAWWKSSGSEPEVVVEPRRLRGISVVEQVRTAKAA